MNNARAVIVASAFALASMSTLADDPERSRQEAAGIAAAKEKKALDGATRASRGREAIGDRGPPKPAKRWEEMTRAEQDATRKRWLLNSGDFGPPN